MFQICGYKGAVPQWAGSGSLSDMSLLSYPCILQRGADEVQRPSAVLGCESSSLRDGTYVQSTLDSTYMVGAGPAGLPPPFSVHLTYGSNSGKQLSF